MSEPKWLDMRISMGHIVQAIILAVGIGAAYAGLAAKQDMLQSGLDAERKLVAQVQTDYIRADVAQARTQALIETLADLKSRLERIENKLDKR